MLAYALKRLGVAAIVVLTVSILTFAFTNIAVDPARAIAGESASDQDIARVRHEYGFDRPLTTQYYSWLRGTLTGDLGTSIRQRRPVIEVLAESFPITIRLACLALSLALLVAIPLGMAAALRPDSWVD